MNTHDIEIELPPLPEGMILEGIWVVTEDELIAYRDACINAAIEADRERIASALEARFIVADAGSDPTKADYAYYVGAADAYEIAEQIVKGERDE